MGPGLEQGLEEEPAASCRSGLTRLEAGALGITAKSSRTRNGNKKVLEDMEELPGLSPEVLDFSAGLLCESRVIRNIIQPTGTLVFWTAKW